mmetsp:Transcript_51539/g.117495  ORF Transcript_51539/g.117495 Transcript_51539/m.117495 type:complete len:283 (-) Transcript_51539:536-1384(-)
MWVTRHTPFFSSWKRTRSPPANFLHGRHALASSLSSCLPPTRVLKIHFCGSNPTITKGTLMSWTLSGTFPRPVAQNPIPPVFMELLVSSTSISTVSTSPKIGSSVSTKASEAPECRSARPPSTFTFRPLSAACHRRSAGAGSPGAAGSPASSLGPAPAAASDSGGTSGAATTAGPAGATSSAGCLYVRGVSSCGAGTGAGAGTALAPARRGPGQVPSARPQVSQGWPPPRGQLPLPRAGPAETPKCWCPQQQQPAPEPACQTDSRLTARRPQPECLRLSSTR